MGKKLCAPRAHASACATPSWIVDAWPARRSDVAAQGPRRRWLPARFPGLSLLIAPSARLPIPLVAPGLGSRVRRIIWRERRLISFGRQHGSPTCRWRPRWRSTEVHGATAGGGRRHREALPGDGDSNIPLIDLASPLPKGLKQVSY